MTTKKKAASERKPRNEAEANAHFERAYGLNPPATPVPVVKESLTPVRLARRWSLTPDGAHYQHAVTGETVPALAVVAQGKAGEGIEAACTRLAAEARDAR